MGNLLECCAQRDESKYTKLFSECQSGNKKYNDKDWPDIDLR